MKFNKKFQILCVTMHQRDFSKVQEMNIHSDIIYANQCDKYSFEKKSFNSFDARMINTATRGVGINRNILLAHADAEICLFADDDCRYLDNAEDIILSEFGKHPDADIFIFYLESNNSSRFQQKYYHTKKCRFFFKIPWAGFRIAFRLSSIRKANIWFSTLYGGGAMYPSGEDSLWLHSAKKQGLTFYVSDKQIGYVNMTKSTWFTGYDYKYFFAKGAYVCAYYSHFALYLYFIYFSLRTEKLCNISFFKKIKWMLDGKFAYDKFISYEEFVKKYGK